MAQFETKSQKASELIARADEKEKEASARAETLRAAADAATAETKTLEARIKALEGGGSEALKAAVDAKEAEVRQHLIGKLKEKVQKAKQDADLGVPSCGGAFTPSKRLVSIRRGRGWFLFRV